MSENTLLKPMVMAGTVVALDKFVMKTQNLNESLYLGLAGAVGAYTGRMVAKALPLPLPTGEYFDGKTLEMRIAEIGIATGFAFGLNKYGLKNDFNRNQMLNKLALLATADFISEYAVDYIQGNKLSFFTN